MSTPGLELVAAVAANGVIGRSGQLPWHLPDDLRHFKKLTLGHAVIMGRRTFESIGKPLPGRTNIVVSTTWQHAPPGVERAGSLDEAIARVSGSARAFVIGGAALYAAALPLAVRLHITELDEAVEGDVYFPALERAHWRLVSQTRHERYAQHAIAFRFCVYERING